MNSGNGGPPGIQTWTNRYNETMRVLYQMIRDPFSDHIVKFKSSIYYDELVSMGIFEEVCSSPTTVRLNIDELRKHSIVVEDDLYENLTDIDWVREQRKKLGLIQGRLKGPEFRKNQQARRKKRREYARQQKLLHEQKPPEELPLSKIIFD